MRVVIREVALKLWISDVDSVRHMFSELTHPPLVLL